MPPVTVGPKSWLDSTMADLGLQQAQPLLDDAQQQQAQIGQQPVQPSLASSIPSLSALLGMQPQQAPAPVPVQAPSVGGWLSSIPGLDALLGRQTAQQLQPQAGMAPAAASGAPVAMPTTGGASSQEPGDLRAWARQEAMRLGIDPDIAERVAAEGEGGFDDPVRQSDVVYQGEREQSYGPYQLNVNGGLGNEAIARGIDPRNPAHARAAVTFALEHAARNGWGNFHGAARIGIGPWDGIGQAPARPVGPQPTTPPQAEQTPAAQAQQQTGRPTQFAEGLSWEEAIAACGLAGVAWFTAKTGRTPKTVAEVKQAAEVSRKWDAQTGMYGAEATASLLRDTYGIPAVVENGVNWEKVRRDVLSGNPVMFDTTGGSNGHYFTVHGARQRADGQWEYDLDTSATDLRASRGRRWYTADEVVTLGFGAPHKTIYVNNPQTPSPSVAVEDMQRLSLNAAPADAPGRAASPAPAGVSSAPAGAPPAPWEMAGAQDGGQMLLKENDETAPMGGADAMLPGDGGVAPQPEYDPRQYDEGARESRPAPIPPTDPTVSDPAYTQNPNAAPMVDPLDPSTITPAALPPMPNGPRMMQPQPQYRDPREGQGVIARGIDAISQYLPSAPIVDTKPGDAGAFMGGMPNTPGKLWEWRGRVAEGAADALSRGTGMDPDALVLNVEVGGIPIQMTVSELLENVTDPLLAAGWGVGDMVLDAAGKAVLRLVAPYAKGAARETIGRLLNSEPVQRGVEAVRSGAESLGRGLQGVGREVAGGLMDLNPGMAPRMAEGGPGIGRAFSDGGRPQQRTVEWLAEQIDYTRRVLDDLDPATEGELIGQVQDRLARLQGEWVDAVNARRALEPRIRSEVGRRVNELPIDERTASDYAGIGRERVSPEAGVPTTVDDTPRSSGLNSGMPFDPGAAAIGAGAGLEEDGEMDPWRTLAGMGIAGFGGRVTRVKPPIAANAQRVAAEAAAGARNGVRMNAPLAARQSNVPALVRRATQFTDDRAAQRWAEDMLTDAAGSPRLPEMDPARPSTLSRINAASIGTQRVDEELAPAVELAAQHGLHHELPQYLADRHQLDILDDAYDAAYRASREAAQEPIDKAKQFGANAGTIQRMEARADAEAEKAGMAALRKAQGPGRDSSYESIDARLKGVEQRMADAGKQQQLDEAAQMVWDHNRQTVERARDAGVISQEEADDLLARFPHLVPTRGETSLRPDGSDAGGTLLERFTSNDAPVNPIVASRMNTLRAERDIQRNAVMQAFGRLIDDAVAANGIQPGRGGRLALWDGEKAVSWMDNGQRKTVYLPGAVADGLEAAANMGVSHNAVIDLWKRVAGFITSSITSARAAFVPVNLIRDLQDFAIKGSTVEGGPQALPRVMGAWLQQAGAAAADLAASNFTVRGGVGAVAGAVTGAAQGDENTTLGERVRNAALMGATGTVLVGANRAQITGDAQKFLARGGGSGGINTGLRSSERWYREVARNGGAVLKTPQDAANYFRDWLSDIATLQGVRAINDRVELIPRAAAMRRAEARGLSETEAVVAGRDVTYDPDRAGTVVRAANGLVPFLNATVQSGAQVKRLFAKHPGAAALTMTATLGPVMLLAEAWNRSDPDRAKAYDDVPQSAKDSGIVVVSPWAGSDARGERPLYGVIPTGLATPFAVVLREAMRSLPGLEPAAGRSTTDPEAGVVQRWADVLSDAVQVFNPVKGDSSSSIASNMVPPVVKQGIELGLNRDLYRGAPIVSDSADERASAFSRKVAEGANAAGRMIGNDFLQEVKPSGVEYMVRQAPAYGDIITGASDMIAPGGQKQAEDRPVANLPGVGGVASRFVKDTGGANLERAQAGRLSEGVRSILEDAGLPPSTIKPVPSRYRNATLTREEQVRWQEATNVYLEEELMNARDSALWDDPARREEAIQKATAKARELAAREVLGLTGSDIRERVEAGAERKAR